MFGNKGVVVGGSNKSGFILKFHVKTLPIKDCSHVTNSCQKWGLYSVLSPPDRVCQGFNLTLVKEVR